MRKILILLTSVALTACSKNDGHDHHDCGCQYKDVRLTVADRSDALGTSHTSDRTMLLHAVPDSAKGIGPDLYCTWTYADCDLNGAQKDSVWFNHRRVGDTVAFKWVRTSRFFHMPAGYAETPKQAEARGFAARVPVFAVDQGRVISTTRPIDMDRLNEDIIAILHSPDSAEFVRRYLGN